MKCVLLFLSNSRYEGIEDEERSGRRVDAVLNGFGLKRVSMPKDGDCLFSAVAL